MRIKNQKIKFVLKVMLILPLLLNTNLIFDKNFVQETPESIKAWKMRVTIAGLRSNITSLKRSSNWMDKDDELIEIGSMEMKKRSVMIFLKSRIRRFFQMNTIYK